MSKHNKPTVVECMYYAFSFSLSKFSAEQKRRHLLMITGNANLQYTEYRSDIKEHNIQTRGPLVSVFIHLGSKL